MDAKCEICGTAIRQPKRCRSYNCQRCGARYEGAKLALGSIVSFDMGRGEVTFKFKEAKQHLSRLG